MLSPGDLTVHIEQTWRSNSVMFGHCVLFLLLSFLSDITCKLKLHFREQKKCHHQYSVLDDFYIYIMFLPSLLLSTVQVRYGKSVSYLCIYYSLWTLAILKLTYMTLVWHRIHFEICLLLYKHNENVSEYHYNMLLNSNLRLSWLAAFICLLRTWPCDWGGGGE